MIIMIKIIFFNTEVEEGLYQLLIDYISSLVFPLEFAFKNLKKEK